MELESGSVSAEIPDWSREKLRRFWDPSRKLLLTIRQYQHWREKPGTLPLIISKWIVLRHRFWSVVTGADIALNATIDGGLIMPHPIGVVIHPGAKIGANCVIFQHVTIGSQPNEVDAPVIEGHVYILAGAKIIGRVNVGKHARIGANSVVLSDVGQATTVFGIPAKEVIAPRSISNVRPQS